MKWLPNLGPMGVSRNQVVLDWLRQPGNCERFMQAGCRSKRLGAVNENKTEVAGLVCTLLQNAGFRGITPQAVVVKLTSLIKSYKRAHALAASGASEDRVLNACSDYYTLVDHIGIAITASTSTTNNNNNPDSQEVASLASRRVSSRSRIPRPASPQTSETTTTTTTNNNPRPQEEATPEPRPVQRSRPRQPTSRAARARPYNLPPSQHQGQSLNQARRARIEELQAHAALIQQMREAGFTKDEIVSYVQQLLQQ